MAVDNTSYLFRKVEPGETRVMEEIFRLRFEVYARQCHFIREEDYPMHSEWDEYDLHSLHFAAMDPNGVVIATSRMILTDQKLSPLMQSFPEITDQYNLCPGSVTEISRFLISKKLRNSRNESSAAAKENPPSLCRYGEIAYGLCQKMFEETQKRGITHWCALMEKSLLVLLRIYGFRMQCVGECINLFGPVRPFVGKIADLEKMWQSRLQLQPQPS